MDGEYTHDIGGIHGEHLKLEDDGWVGKKTKRKQTVVVVSFVLCVSSLNLRNLLPVFNRE